MAWWIRWLAVQTWGWEYLNSILQYPCRKPCIAALHGPATPELKPWAVGVETGGSVGLALLPPAYFQDQWEILSQVNIVDRDWLHWSLHRYVWVHAYSHTPHKHTTTCVAIYTYTTHTNSIGHFPIHKHTHMQIKQQKMLIFYFLGPALDLHAGDTASLQATKSSLPSQLSFSESQDSPLAQDWVFSCFFFFPGSELLSSGKLLVKPSVRIWWLKDSLHTGGWHFEIKACLTLMRLYSLKGRWYSGSFQKQGALFLRVGLLSGT